MSVAEAVSRILTLSRAERLRVAQEIIKSVATEDDPPLTEAERKHLDRAIAEATAHPGVGRSWEEVEADMVAREEQ
jgi:putative addiction module component (TIGR02574 family)